MAEVEADTAARVGILLVDDRPDNLLVLDAILGDLGHELVTARCGADALAQLRAREFAVVLLDVRMAGMDGFETARRLRADDRANHTPIIFLTAHDENRARVEEAYQLGAVDYLVKPLSPVILRAKVAGFVELYQKTLQVRQQAEQLRALERREFEAQRLVENRRFRVLTEYSSDAVVLIDPTARVLYASPSIRHVLGYEPEEFVGQLGLGFVHPDDLARVQARLGELVREPSGRVRVETRVRHKDGSWRWVEALGTNLLAEPVVAAVVVNFRDITERQEATAELREREQWFHTLADSIPQLAWMARPDGRVIWYNRRFYDYTGKTPRAMQGMGWRSVYDRGQLPRVLKSWRAALVNGTPWEDTFLLRRHDGQLRWHLSRAVPVRDQDNRVVRWFGTNTDITDRIEMEAQLKEADRRKDEFLAMLAHELRNPLAPIRNALYVLARPDATATAAAQARELVERQVHNMVRLVDDLLDVSRITRGKIQLRLGPLDLTLVLRRAVEAGRPLIEANRHTLSVTVSPQPIRVLGDPTRLEQVFANLLNNAAKYTERGGSIWVTAELHGNEASVRVRDSGFGIPATVLPHIFDLFTQGERTLDRAQGGLGIGLTLVRTLVEMHGGRVSATSDGPGHGSAFTVCLPCVADAPQAPTVAPDNAATPAPSSKSAVRVLVVEDNRDAAQSLTILLGLWGHEVRTAHDGLSGLKAACSYRPQVVLLDIGLPGLDGYEVARRLRLEPGLHPRLIAMTGYGQEEDRRRAQEAGFDAHLVKPVDPEILQQLLAGL